MPVLYLRVTEDVHEYVEGLAEDAGVSMAKAAAALLGEARRRGWTVTPAGVREDQAAGL
jgi:hypothetical protein